jgi:Pterin-4a-carbinolamine dehydratase
MERRKLSAEEIENRLPELKSWTAAEAKLSKKFEFANFAESLAFVNRVGEIAERMDHHPDILFGWGYAEFFITTHSEGGLTEFDFALAKEIDALSNEGE